MRKRLTILAVVIGLMGLPALAGAPALGAPPIGPDKLADFEAGLPGNWFAFNGGGSAVTTTDTVVGETEALARPFQSGANGVLQVNFNVTDFGGFGDDLSAAPKDWSLTEGCMPPVPGGTAMG